MNAQSTKYTVLCDSSIVHYSPVTAYEVYVVQLASRKLLQTDEIRMSILSIKYTKPTTFTTGLKKSVRRPVTEPCPDEMFSRGRCNVIPGFHIQLPT